MRTCLSFLTCLAMWALGPLSALGQGDYRWEKDLNNPMFTGGGAGKWDASVLAPCVLFNADSGRYEMWYTGGEPGGKINGIGFAVSDDGINWTRMSETPVLTPTQGAWDSVMVLSGWVLREDGTYKMWYTGWSSTSSNGFPHHIGHAVSANGIDWTKRSGPVLSPGTQAWEATAVEYCCVIPTGGGYTMYYGGATSTNARIGRAFSVDGNSWIRDTLNNPVLSGGPSGSWDGNAYLPRVVSLNGMLQMYYTAEKVPRGGASRIGVATSADSGRTWVKDTLNPIISPGPSGSWEVSAVELGAVVVEGDHLRMWYDGEKYTPLFVAAVGHATGIINAVEYERVVPGSFRLAQNYPNPFNPGTTIRYALPERSYVTLTVFNTLGQRIATLVEGEMEAGYHEVKFEASHLPSGVYLYRLQAGTRIQVRRALLMK